MDKSHLLKTIAEIGYNVGFGAKKHFATFDIVCKAPGWIAIISFAVGVYALVWEPLSHKFVGATLAVLGMAGMYISLYDSEKSKYNESGIKLTEIFGRLRDLYRDIQCSADGQDLSSFRVQMDDLQSRAYEAGISKQILFSDWYAHYKFFWQHQIDWIDEQKSFSFWRDKLPLSIILCVGTAVLIGVGAALTFAWSSWG